MHPCQGNKQSASDDYFGELYPICRPAADSSKGYHMNFDVNIVGQ